MIYTVDELKVLAYESVDPDYYRTNYALFMFASGEYDPALGLMDQFKNGTGSSAFSKQRPLPEFPDISYRDPTSGVQNHQLVNSRIMVENLIYADPDITISIEDPLVRAYNEEWLKERWRQGRWPAVFLNTGMHAETTGIGFVTIGLSQQGAVMCKSVSPLDMIWDPINKNPSDWEFFFIRDRLTLHAFLIKYGHMFSKVEDAKAYFQEHARVISNNGVIPRQTAPRVLEEWSFWSVFQHYVFLGGFDSSNKVAYWDEKEERYIAPKTASDKLPKSDSTEGGNMFGVIPVSVWWDYFAPGVHRPVGKCETTYRVASQSNHMEKMIKELIDNIPPLNIISTVGLRDDDLIKKIEANGGRLSREEIGFMIVTDHPDVASLIQRIPGAQIDPALLQMRAMMKEEMNASTGISDAFRGQRVGGEGERVTALEVNTINQSQGVQARHMRRQFSNFLEDLLVKVRFIGSQFDELESTIYAGGIRFSPKYPAAVFLRVPATLSVSESSIQYQDKLQRYNSRLARFNALDKVFIELQAADPAAVMQDVYEDIDVQDWKKLVAKPQVPVPMPGQPGMPGMPGQPPTSMTANENAGQMTPDGQMPQAAQM